MRTSRTSLRSAEVTILMIFLCAFILSSIVGCTPNTTSPDTAASNVPPPPPTPKIPNARPEIPRTNPPQDMQSSTSNNNNNGNYNSNSPPAYQNPGEQPHGKEPLLLDNTPPHIDLDVPYGEPIGRYFPIITAQQFPLLSHPVVRVDQNAIMGYEETLRFDFPNSTGKMIFDKDNQEIGTFFLYEENKPLLEYKLRLFQGTFKDIQGRDIQVLGHTYLVAEVTNYSVALFGKDVASTLFFEQGQNLEVNKSSIRNTICNITSNSISYVLYVEGDDDGNILLSPGEDLAQNLGRGALASDLFNIRYKGAGIENVSRILLAQSKHGYALEFNTFKGKIRIPIVEADANNNILLGGINNQLQLTPCTTATQYCTAPGTMLALTSGNGKTLLLRYEGAHVDPAKTGQVLFSDINNNRYTFEFSGEPGKDATTSVQLEATSFRVNIGAAYNNSRGASEYNISIDQGYRNGIVDLVDTNGVIIRVLQPTNLSSNDVPVQILKTKAMGEENILLHLRYAPSTQKWSVSVDNLTFFNTNNERISYALSGNGTMVRLQLEDSLPPLNTGNNAEVIVPISNFHGTLRLEG